MTTLEFKKIELFCGELGPESTVPDIVCQNNVQNQTKFELDEYDEIYEGYGQRPNAYPYRQQDNYSRKLRKKAVNAAVLENDLIRAEFLPDFGGRLWKLYDKVNGRDVLYTNDCLRASNLAIRNAWFSGGSEWNCGVIGHSPFTMDRVFAARAEKNGVPVLRMYAFERIRSVIYQMDFWLDERVPALNCHMSVNNSTFDVVPMYWWSNIASPLYQNGRLLVPGHKAYSYEEGRVVKLDIPYFKEGMDVSKYECLPISKDFFFVLDKDAPRWIANVDENGWGMLHTSTNRLQSRKLFVWGHNNGSWRWQEHLTQAAGPYIELQAGLGKTQYGCIPMAPHTTWEWTERYESIKLSEEQQQMTFDEAGQSISAKLIQENVIASVDCFGHDVMLCPSQVVYEGTGDAALEDALRKKLGKRPLREHLKFNSSDSRQQEWEQFLKTGILAEPQEEFPQYDPMGSDWLMLLKKSIKSPEGQNWYAYYCISLLERQEGRMDLAQKAIDISLSKKTTACGCYVQSVYNMERGEKEEAIRFVCKGLALTNPNFSFVKAALDVLMKCKAWQELLNQIQILPVNVSEVSRIQLYKAYALYHLNRNEEALAILEKDGGLQLDDIREGELGMGDLWTKVKFALTGEKQQVPHQFDFDALSVGYCVE